MRRWLHNLLLCLLFCWGMTSFGITQAAAPIEISFGVTPHQSAAELAKLWVPICQYLSKRTGYEIQFKTAKDLMTYWSETYAGRFDLIYINPYHYTKAETSAGYLVLAKDDGAPLVGMIFARRDGPQDVKALQGLKVATHDVSAFMTKYVRHGYLKEQGIDIEPVGVGSLDSVYLTVDRGLYPAGISIQRAYGLLDPAMQAHFKVLWKSDPLPPFAYAAHPRLAPSVQEKIRRALLDMEQNAEGRALLNKLNIRGIVAANNKDYDQVRRLKLE